MFRSKKFSLLMALVFAFTVIVPFAGIAGASTTYSALSTPTVGDETTGDLGTVLVKIDRLESGIHEALFTLPNDFEYDYSQFSVVEGVYQIPSTNIDSDSGGVEAAIEKVSDNEFKLIVDCSSLDSDVEILVPFKNTYVEGDDGDIELIIDGIEGQLPSGSVVIGQISGGDVTVSVTDDETFDDTGQVVIRIKESLKGALGSESDAVKFELPDGFVWNESSGSKSVDVLWGGTLKDGSLSTVDLGVNEEEIEIGIGQDTDEATCFEITLNIEVEDYGDAEQGDIVAKVRGDAGATPKEIVVGTFGDYGVTVTAEDPEDVFAGKAEQAIADINIEENLDGSLIAGRSVFIELPDYAAWSDKTGMGVLYQPDDTSILDNFEIVNDQLIRAKVKKSGDVTLEDAEILIEAGAPEGALEVKVYGSAIGEEVTLEVANVLTPVTVETDPKDVKIGRNAQETGDIVITESKAGALVEDEELVIALPKGVEFNAAPESVEVTEGDLEIGSVTEDDRYLYIEIDRDSDEASTITISGIKLDVDRTVAEGVVGFKILGPAVVDYVTYGDVTETDSDGSVLWVWDAPWPNSDWAVKGAIANVVTPVPDEEMLTTSIQLGDGGSYISDGRIMVQLRDAATALGVAEQNIFWDNNTKSVTFIKGDRVVQLTVGDPAVKLNGTSLPTDKGAEIKDGRTYVSLRAAGIAFGAAVDWDNTTKTATLTVK